MKKLMEIVEIAVVILAFLMTLPVLLVFLIATLDIGQGSANIRQFSEEYQEAFANALRLELAPSESFYSLFYSGGEWGSTARVVVQGIDCVDDFVSRYGFRLWEVDIDETFVTRQLHPDTFRVVRQNLDTPVGFFRTEDGISAEFHFRHVLGNGASRFRHVYHIIDNYRPNPFLQAYFLVPVSVQVALIILAFVFHRKNSYVIVRENNIN